MTTSQQIDANGDTTRLTFYAKTAEQRAFLNRLACAMCDGLIRAECEGGWTEHDTRETKES